MLYKLSIHRIFGGANSGQRESAFLKRNNASFVKRALLPTTTKKVSIYYYIKDNIYKI
jgi:hypothetical protein